MTNGWTESTDIPHFMQELHLGKPGASCNSVYICSTIYAHTRESCWNPNSKTQNLIGCSIFALPHAVLLPPQSHSTLILARKILSCFKLLFLKLYCIVFLF